MNILNYIARETSGKTYKSYKYCFETVEIPKLIYDDKKEIQVKTGGETDKSLKKPKSVLKLAEKISKTDVSLFRYFLDGSRRIYKVDDIAYDNKLYPIIAGQIGVAICERTNVDSFKPCIYENPLIIALPKRANALTSNDQLFYNNLTKKLNEQQFIKDKNLSFKKIVSYDDSPLKDNDRYEDKGIASIQDEMVKLEKIVVSKCVKDNSGFIKNKSFLIKDGSLEYQKMTKGELNDLSKIKTNYSHIIGVSKTFNPEALAKNIKNISRIIADLELYHRTPAFMYETPRIPNVQFAVWYIRIRNTVSPFDGILKIEKILVWEREEVEGLDSDQIDLISAHIINERNPVTYGYDKRWAKHLYPIYLTEQFIKSRYLSDIHFMNLF